MKLSFVGTLIYLKYAIDVAHRVHCLVDMIPSTIKVFLLFSANLVSETSESDISNLGSINDGNILEVIDHRYKNGLVHTNCAESCIFLNPNQMFPIYSPYVTKAYATEHMDKLPPHIFRVGKYIIWPICYYWLYFYFKRDPHSIRCVPLA